MNSVLECKNLLKTELEILIIDNGSTDDTEDVVKNLGEKHNIIYHMVDKQGLSHARNMGVKFARGKWLVYIDDDCYVDDVFFLELQKTIDEYDFDAFTGLYLPWHISPKPKWLPRNFGKKKVFAQSIGRLVDPDFLSGGIMAIKKSIFKTTGLFPTNLGMIGNKIAYGEEKFIQLKLEENGFKIGINPHWKIHHLVRHEKYQLMWHLKSAYAKGRDEYRISKKKSMLRVIGIGLKLSLTSTMKGVPLLLKKDYFYQNLILDIFGPLLNCMGRLSSLIGTRIEK